jgi:hypothetical protein
MFVCPVLSFYCRRGGSGYLLFISGRFRDYLLKRKSVFLSDRGRKVGCRRYIVP